MSDSTSSCSKNGSHPSDCEILEGYRTRVREKMQEKPSEEDRLLLAKAESIRLLLLDVDGVLTDGSLLYTEEGVEAKAFNTQDGLGIRLVQRCKIDVGIITARNSNLVQRRAEELGFRGSPTILINGDDPFLDTDAPVGLSCRIYAANEGYRGNPPECELRAAIARSIGE